jgi:UDP-glucose:(heptosyl)LPS alpha-1,3-glucosyltransferase
MKVALAIERFDPRAGGAERYAWDLSATLLGRGHEVTVLCLRAAGRPAGIQVFSPRLPALLPTAARVYLFARFCGREAARGNFDVVHGLMKSLGSNLFHPHTGSHRASLEASLEAESRGRGKDLRALARRLSLRQRVFLRIEDAQYRMPPPGLFVAVSKMVQKDMVERHGVDPARIRVVYNGVDTERFSPGKTERSRELRKSLAPGTDEVLVLHAAHNPRLKGLGTLLRAVAALPGERRDRVRVCVAGRASPGRWTKLAARLGLGANLCFTGHVEDMEEYYRAADLFVLPTFYDPCSLTVLEAMACGTPVLTSARNGAAELFGDRQKEWVLSDPADAGGLAGLIEPFFDPGVRRTAGAKVRAIAAAYGAETNHRRIIEIYKEVMEGSS